MDAIVAVYSDWGIGDGGTQPVVLKADRVHFREVTADAAVIVGRKTLSDFPGGRPLKNRTNIVVTRQDISIPEAIVVHSTDEALAAASAQKRTIVIGGASIYEQFFPYTDRVFLTKIFCRPDSSRFFHNLDEDIFWNCVQEGPVLEEDGISYQFCIYERSDDGCLKTVKRLK